MWSMPSLPTPYAPNQRWVRELAIEEIPTIDPPPAAAIGRAACLIVSIVPVMLRSIVRRHASVSICVIGPSVSEPPAHAITASERTGRLARACDGGGDRRPRR